MKVVFDISTGLGDRVAEVGDTEELPDRLAKEFLHQGRVHLAPDEAPLPPSTGLTTESMGLDAPSTVRRHSGNGGKL